jgi:hypothetical protein
LADCLDPASPAGATAICLVGTLSDADLISCTINFLVGRSQAVLLFDTPTSTAGNRAFLRDHPGRPVVAIGKFAEGVQGLEHRLNTKVSALIDWNQDQPTAIRERLFPNPSALVMCPRTDRRLLLMAAYLAGALKAPLYLTSDQMDTDLDCHSLPASWRPKNVYLVGKQSKLHDVVLGATRVNLPDESAVAKRCLELQSQNSSLESFLVTNPADGSLGFSNLSPLAPWLAIKRRAALVLSGLKGNDVEKRIDQLFNDSRLRSVEHLLILADLKAIPMQRRANPIPGGRDTCIEMEPLTPAGFEPFTLATGRIFHPDRGTLALLLARSETLCLHQEALKALVASNSSGGLPLVEALSRSTAQELRNAGYNTTAWHGDGVNESDLHRLLPEQDLFLWEGHYNTLMKEYCVQDWPEPLRPSLVFLQSCLALSESKAQPLIERGAVGVIGASTRTYSGSGGACALAFFDALVYEGQTLGASLRQAKNFLLTYALLKQKLLGSQALLTGANLRSAWAFTLWGDPTITLPRPSVPPDAIPPVCYTVRGNTVIVAFPDMSYEAALSGRFLAQLLPNARAAGLVYKTRAGEPATLVPLVFGEIHLPDGPPGTSPVLQSRLPARRWVFCWDPRRHSGYLLASPRASDCRELRFHVKWDPDDAIRCDRAGNPNSNRCQPSTVAGSALSP